MRDIGDGARVEGDVFAGATVTAGGGVIEHAVAVHQRQRDPVDLELAQVLGSRAHLVGHPGDPRSHLVGVEDVVQRQHSLKMVDGRERGGESSADELGRRVGSGQLRMRLLEFLQTPQQPVELAVGDDRCVFDVVPELMFTDLLGQRRPLFSHVADGPSFAT